MVQPARTKSPAYQPWGLFTAYWATVACCLGMLLFIFLQNQLNLEPDAFKVLLLTGSIALIAAGITLIYLSAISKLPRNLRLALLWTGISAAGIPACAVLHNLAYALLELLFGKGFWSQGGDEPVFFILAIVVLPLVFLGSAIYVLVMIVRGVRVMPPDHPAR